MMSLFRILNQRNRETNLQNSKESSIKNKRIIKSLNSSLDSVKQYSVSTSKIIEDANLSENSQYINEKPESPFMRYQEIEVILNLIY